MREAPGHVLIPAHRTLDIKSKRQKREVENRRIGMLCFCVFVSSSFFPSSFHFVFTLRIDSMGRTHGRDPLCISVQKFVLLLLLFTPRISSPSSHTSPPSLLSSSLSPFDQSTHVKMYVFLSPHLSLPLFNPHTSICTSFSLLTFLFLSLWSWPGHRRMLSLPTS